MNQRMNNIWNFEDQVIPRRAQILSKQVSLSFIDWDLSFQRSSLSLLHFLSFSSLLLFLFFTFSPSLSLLRWIFNDFSFLRFTLPFQSFIIISLLSETWLSRDMDGMMIWYWMVCEEKKWELWLNQNSCLSSFSLSSFSLSSFSLLPLSIWTCAPISLYEYFWWSFGWV